MTKEQILESLAARTEPHRGLDVQIARLFEWEGQPDVFGRRFLEVMERFDGAEIIGSDIADSWNVPRYTGSVEAALTLNDGFEVTIRTGAFGTWGASLYGSNMMGDKRWSFSATGSTPALALCQACVKAKGS